MRNNIYEPSEIVLTEKEFGEDLWGYVGQTLKILTRAGYTTTVYDDNYDIVVIKFGYKNEEYGDIRPCWLTPEQYESVMFDKEEDTPEGA